MPLLALADGCTYTSTHTSPRLDPRTPTARHSAPFRRPPSCSNAELHTTGSERTSLRVGTLNRSLMRSVLADVKRRAAPAPRVVVKAIDYAPEICAEHVRLALEAKWIEAAGGRVREPRRRGPVVWVSRLTYRGHEELARMRRELHDAQRG